MTELSSKLADAYREGFVAAHSATVDEHHAKAVEHRTAFMETMERELSSVIAAMDVLDFDDPTMPDEVKKMFGPIANPTHQVDLFFSIGAAFGLLFTGAAAASAGLNNGLQNKSMRKWGMVYPSANESASMMVRGILNEKQGNDFLNNVGANDPIRQKLIDAAWQDLPVDEVMRLMRLRIISVDEGRAIFKKHAIPTIQIEYLILSLVGPIDFGTAVAAVTQSQITTSEFQALLPQYGIDAKYADVIFKTAGQSPPPELAGRLFREGWIDETLFKKMLLESPLKNEYVDLLANLRFRFPPMRSTLKMFTDGLIDAATAQTYLTRIGFFPEDARLLVESASKHQSTSVKALSPSTIERLYAVGKWDRATADSALQTLGYDAIESGLLLDLVDESKSHSAMERAANKIGTRYITWKIDRAAASVGLDGIGYPVDQRDELLDIWEVERDAQTLHLTRVDIKKAVQTGTLTQEQGKARLLGMGYEQSDVDIIVRIDGWSTAAGVKEKDLTRADQVKLYKQGTIDRAALVAALIHLGYDENEAEQIAKLADGG